MEGLVANNQETELTCIDLFAGIGGMRLGFNGPCVFSSEIDLKALACYMTNFGREHRLAGDITQVDATSIPNHDVLMAGFPCQPFSVASHTKHGFQDKTRGTLFFEICRILEKKQPSAFLLENVPNLYNHCGGQTFDTIKAFLTELGYKIYWDIISSEHWVPQKRKRLYIIGFLNHEHRPELLYDGVPLFGPTLGSILETNVPSRYTLTDGMWQFLQKRQEKMQSAKTNEKFNCFNVYGPNDVVGTLLASDDGRHYLVKQGNFTNYNLCGPDDVAPTLLSRYYKDGRERIIKQLGNPRRLTPRECARLMGFPESFKIYPSDAVAYKQFGNAVVVPVIAHISKYIRTVLGGLSDQQSRNNSQGQ